MDTEGIKLKAVIKQFLVSEYFIETNGILSLDDMTKLAMHIFRHEVFVDIRKITTEPNNYLVTVRSERPLKEHESNLLYYFFRIVFGVERDW